MRPLFCALAGLCLLAALAVPVAAETAAADSLPAGNWLENFRALFRAFATHEVRVEPGLHPSFDLRLRQEVLSDLYTFDPVEPDRDWIRLRSRGGLAYGWGNAHEVEARLCNEFRRISTPKTPIKHDEIILDRLLYRYRPNDWATLTLGRQDITWDDGFLVMDGTPLDGSRSAYMNALRLEFAADDPDLSLLEGFVAHNPAYDDFILLDDEVAHRLTDADETAAALRLRVRPGQFALIWKRERDPDHARPALDAWTLGYRAERVRGATGLMAEAALQLQDWSGGAAGADNGGYAWAGQLRLRRAIGDRSRADLGLFAYTGRDGDQLPFHTPWGRWPKWSELMLYRLIGEGGVGAWANLAGPWIEYEHNDRNGLMALGGQLLLAPDPSWGYRGLLLRLRLERSLKRGLTAQLLVEQFGFLIGGKAISYSPAYGDGAGVSIEKRSGRFLRLQFNYEVK
jgi:hypothetical protein